MTAPITRRRAVSWAAAVALPWSTARAQNYPSRPQRIIVPVSAGSAGDTLMRYLGDQLTQATKQPVVIDNKPGADGLIAMQSLLTAPADGYSILLLGPQPLVFNPLMRNDLPYSLSDLRNVVGVAQFWNVLVTGPKSRFSNFDELVAAARKDKGGVTVATYGLSFRIGAAYLARQMGTEFRHVPYKNTSQLIPDVTAGLVDAALVPASGMAALMAADKMRVLASASRNRLPQLPQAPTIRERGIDFDWPLWTALSVRSGTPEPIVRSLEAQLHKALATREMHASVTKLDSFEVNAMTSQEIDALVARDTNRLRDVVKQIASEQNVEAR